MYFLLYFILLPRYPRPRIHDQHLVVTQPVQLVNEEVYLRLPRACVRPRVRLFRCKDLVNQGDDGLLLGGCDGWNRNLSEILPNQLITILYLRAELGNKPPTHF